MSKLTNWFVDKFGADKMLHFLVGAWITSISTFFGWYGVIPAFLIVFALSYVKEELLDTEFDTDDILAAMIGCVVSVLIYGGCRLLF